MTDNFWRCEPTACRCNIPYPPPPKKKKTLLHPLKRKANRAVPPPSDEVSKYKWSPPPLSPPHHRRRERGVVARASWVNYRCSQLQGDSRDQVLERHILASFLGLEFLPSFFRSINSYVFMNKPEYSCFADFFGMYFSYQSRLRFSLQSASRRHC